MSKHNESNDLDNGDEYDTEAVVVYMKNFKSFFKNQISKHDINVKKQKQAYRVIKTWGDSESEKGDNNKDKENYMTYVASLNSCEDSESSDNELEEEESIGDLETLKAEYNDLYSKSIKVNKMNIKLIEKLRDTEKINGNYARDLLASQAHEKELDEKNDLLNKKYANLTKNFNALQDEMHGCVENNKFLESNVVKLQRELDNANAIFKKMNTSSQALDDMLSVQKAGLNKEGLGYVEGVSSSKAGGKMVFVKANNSTLTPPTNQPG
ncbi:hypothetical protein RHGRI_031019 [Rhododendron griersonianum]|uniref:Uncharacterized protein n=1 Tax=Rhododendron griersonianum TaxID=479676 RepID=A0AAV6IC05_9ERIC|nr:hypothetical protein RHGRI_031019 [Rhododendron griersonianum]